MLLIIKMLKLTFNLIKMLKLTFKPKHEWYRQTIKLTPHFSAQQHQYTTRRGTLLTAMRRMAAAVLRSNASFAALGQPPRASMPTATAATVRAACQRPAWKSWKADNVAAARGGRAFCASSSSSSSSGGGDSSDLLASTTTLFVRVFVGGSAFHVLDASLSIPSFQSAVNSGRQPSKQKAVARQGNGKSVRPTIGEWATHPHVFYTPASKAL